MISIVSCHICQFYDLVAAWWLNVGVQVFLVISGYIFGLRPTPGAPVEWFAKRFRRIYVPYLLTLVLLIMMNLVFDGAVLGRHELLAALCLRSGSVPNGTHLWYVSVILLCYLVTPVLGWVERKSSPWLLLPLAIAASVVGWLLVPSGWWVCVYVLGFAMGRFVLRGVGDSTVMRRCALLSGGALCLSLVPCALQPVFGHWVDSAGYIGGHVSGGVFVFCLVRLLAGGTAFEPPAWLATTLRLSDEYSYEVYLVHQIVILGAFSVFAAMPLVPGVAVVVVWSVVAAFVVHGVSGLILKRIEIAAR